MMLELRSSTFFCPSSNLCLKVYFKIKNSGTGGWCLYPNSNPNPYSYPFLVYLFHTHFFQFFIPISTINEICFSDSDTSLIPIPFKVVSGEVEVTGNELVYLNCIGSHKIMSYQFHSSWVIRLDRIITSNEFNSLGIMLEKVKG